MPKACRYAIIANFDTSPPPKKIHPKKRTSWGGLVYDMIGYMRLFDHIIGNG